MGNLYSLGLLTPIPSLPGAADYDNGDVKDNDCNDENRVDGVPLPFFSRSHGELYFSLLLRKDRETG